MDNSDITNSNPPTQGSDLSKLYDGVVDYVSDATGRVIEIANAYPSVDKQKAIAISAQGVGVISSISKARLSEPVSQAKLSGDESADTQEAELKTYILPSEVITKLTAYKSEVDPFLTNPPQTQDQGGEDDIGSDKAEAGSV
jgi:hypothetical protein